MRKVHQHRESKDVTRDLLVEAALELFSQKGLNGTSLRQVISAAGTSNQSAIQYYFESRRGLINAVLDEINSRLEIPQREALNILENSSKTRSPAAREIVEIGFAPFIAMITTPQGRRCLRFLSRLTWESGNEGQDLLLQEIRPYFMKLLDYLEPAIPGKSREALEIHMYLGVSNLIHGLSDIAILGRDPASATSKLYREKPDELLRFFFNYVSAGLSGYEGIVAEPPGT